MGCTIQFESHRNELAAILEFEHDPLCREYYDQPPSIELNYRSKSGKEINVLHTPDFFVLHQQGAGWVECKTEEDLVRLAEMQPYRYQRDERGGWRSRPGEEFAVPRGLSYRLKSSAEIDWRFQRNVLFLEDYLRAEELEICPETIVCFQSLVAAQPGARLADLLAYAAQYDLASDLIYILLVTDRLYTDLSAAVLAEPDQVHIYYDEATARRFADPIVRPSSSRPAKIDAGRNIVWDGKRWQIINPGETTVWLRDESEQLISISTSALQELIGQGRIVATADDRDAQQAQFERVRSLLASASPADLAEANRRYRILNADRETSPLVGEQAVSPRTLQRWSAAWRQAEIEYECGFVGLLPHVQGRGNRSRRLPEATQEATAAFIREHYENVRQPNRFTAWAKFKHECEAKSLSAPSYRTFCRELGKRPKHEQKKKREGWKAAYDLEVFHYELSTTTPRHGDRPFEIGHIDHSPLDIELVCSRTGKGLGRPWLTLMIDAWSRRILAIDLSFDPPSYRSCMMVMRECVTRHRRLPQTIVVDGGKEFHGAYFETLLARYECTKKQRPPAQPRFGSVCERLFGIAETRFIYTLIGNTQMTKNNVRQLVPSVDPKKLAAWTYEALLDRLSEFVYEIYDTIDHPALGQSPREAFSAGLAKAGARRHRLIYDEEEFRLLTLPTTTKGKARVQPGRGVKINYIYYWCAAFRDGEIEGREVAVRYDPYDAGRAYAYVRNGWHQCLSEYYHIFHDRSERELMIAAAELRRRNQNHQRGLPITASRLASFLKTAENEEALLIQRRRDAAVGATSMGRKMASEESARNAETGKVAAVETDPAEPEESFVDFDELEIYEEY
jgi:transposase InsO family protein